MTDTNPENALSGGSASVRRIGKCNIIIGVLMIVFVTPAHVLIVATLPKALLEPFRHALVVLIAKGNLNDYGLLQRMDRASTPEERQSYRNQLTNEAQERLSQVPFPPPVVTNGVLTKAYLTEELAFGLLANGLLLIAGIGLLQYRSEARRLTLRLAAIKLFHLTASCAFLLFVVTPARVETLKSALVTLQSVDALEISDREVQILSTKAQWRFGFWYGAGMLILGSIYPIIILRVLRRPQMVAACTSRGCQRTDTDQER